VSSSGDPIVSAQGSMRARSAGDSELAGQRRRRGFLVTTAILGLFLFAAAAPTPLYDYYARLWRFSAISLTAVFAVYAANLPAALLVFGSLSDALGRRPVIALALALEAASMVVFILAGGLPALYLARIIQGLATGLITGAVAATLIDLQPPDRPGAGALVNAVTPTFGLAAGALVAGTLVQYAAAPRQLVYIIMLDGFVLLLAALAIVPEPVTSPNRPQIRVRLTVERTVRAAFASAVPALVATWALGGLYLSLGPSLAYELSGSGNRLVGAMVVALLAGAGGAASLAIRSWAPRKTMLTGCAVLACGTAVTAAGITGNSFAVYCAGTVIAGTGFGSSFLGAFRTLAGLASPDGRGGLVSAIYMVAYLAFSVPAVIAGLLTVRLGLRPTAIGYAAVLGVLALVSLPATAKATSRASTAIARQ
jgi:MFS family permease